MFLKLFVAALSVALGEETCASSRNLLQKGLVKGVLSPHGPKGGRGFSVYLEPKKYAVCQRASSYTVIHNNYIYI